MDDINHLTPLDHYPGRHADGGRPHLNMLSAESSEIKTPLYKNFEEFEINHHVIRKFRESTEPVNFGRNHKRS